MTEELNHVRPNEKIPHHTVELIVEGTRVGHADLVYMKAPFPFYYVSDLNVPREYQGRGYGRRILRALGEIIKKRGAAGLLDDTSEWEEDANPDAEGMYERHGWFNVAATTETIEQGNW